MKKNKRPTYKQHEYTVRIENEIWLWKMYDANKGSLLKELNNQSRKSCKRFERLKTTSIWEY